MKNILIKTSIAALVILSQVILKESQSHYLNLVMLIVALFISIHLHEKFFPLFTISIGLFIAATVQELYDVQYLKEPITIALHIAARLMFAIAIIMELFKTRQNEKL